MVTKKELQKTLKQHIEIAKCVSENQLKEEYERIDTRIGKLMYRFFTRNFEGDTPENTRLEVTKLINAKMILLNAMDCSKRK